MAERSKTTNIPVMTASWD